MIDADDPTTPSGGAAWRRRSAAHVLIDPAMSLDVIQLALTEEVEHHLVRVVRLGDGELVSATDGAGSWRMFRSRRVRTGLVAEAEGDIHFEPQKDRFAIASAIPKGDRLDWLVQKVSELGADRIALLEADRSVVRWKPERAARSLERLQRIADEATRQSRRVWRTTVEPPANALDIVSGATIAEPGGEAVRGDEEVIAIGPEGGWSQAEVETSLRCVTLGDSVLRTETAAVVATTLRMVKAH